MEDQLEKALPVVIHHYVETGKWAMEDNFFAETVHPAAKGKWFPDGFHALGGNKAGKIYYEILGVMLIALIFGISYTLYLCFLGALYYFAIRSAIIDWKLMKPERVHNRALRQAKRAQKKREKELQKLLEDTNRDDSARETHEAIRSAITP